MQALPKSLQMKCSLRYICYYENTVRKIWWIFLTEFIHFARMCSYMKIQDFYNCSIYLCACSGVHIHWFLIFREEDLCFFCTIGVCKFFADSTKRWCSCKNTSHLHEFMIYGIVSFWIILAFCSFDSEFEDVIYPKEDSDAVSISKRDVDLLQPETFINDTIIDFYIK
jgi:hypothetical protein